MRRLVFKLEDVQVLVEIPQKGAPRLSTRPNSYSTWGPPREPYIDVTATADFSEWHRDLDQGSRPLPDSMKGKP